MKKGCLSLAFANFTGVLRGEARMSPTWHRDTLLAATGTNQAAEEGANSCVSESSLCHFHQLQYVETDIRREESPCWYARQTDALSSPCSSPGCQSAQARPLAHCPFTNHGQRIFPAGQSEGLYTLGRSLPFPLSLFPLPFPLLLPFSLPFSLLSFPFRPAPPSSGPGIAGRWDS